MNIIYEQLTLHEKGLSIFLILHKYSIVFPYQYICANLANFAFIARISIGSHVS